MSDFAKNEVYAQVYLNGICWDLLHPQMRPEMLGFIPSWIYPELRGPLKDALNYHYQHGGGWQPFKGFTLNRENLNLEYPEDPPTIALARCQVGDETLVFYQHSWVAIIQQDWSFEVCRMD